MHKSTIAAFALAAFATPASAAVVYSNNFDAENGGNTALNYNSFNGLTVTDGTVDLVKSGDYGIICAGGAGACVDLDGSTNNAGLTSSNSYAFNAGERVSLTFLFSGNQRQLPADFALIYFQFGGVATGTWGYNSTAYGNGNLGSFNTTELGLGLPNVQPGLAMTDFEFFFLASSAGTVSFTFEDQGNDNVGVIIDNVALSIGAVPEPSAWALLILGFGAVGAAARRRHASGRIAAA